MIGLRIAKSHLFRVDLKTRDPIFTGVSYEHSLYQGRCKGVGKVNGMPAGWTSIVISLTDISPTNTSLTNIGGFVNC